MRILALGGPPFALLPLPVLDTDSIDDTELTLSRRSDDPPPPILLGSTFGIQYHTRPLIHSDCSLRIRPSTPHSCRPRRTRMPPPRTPTPCPSRCGVRVYRVPPYRIVLYLV